MAIDVDRIKAAASGRAVESLIAAGIGSEFLDGKHHPCPLCGGTDRFRLIDPAAGAVICNKCFSGKGAADFLGAIQWFRSCSFVEACEFAAGVYGVDPKKSPKKKNLSELVRKTGEITESVASSFSLWNDGITFLGLDRAGAFCARHGSQSVIAFPAIGQDGTSVVNYSLMAMHCERLAIYDRRGAVVNMVRKKTVAKGRGMIGVHSVAAIMGGKCEVAWKCEGPTDLAAILSVTPEEELGRHSAVSNLHGALEEPDWQAVTLALASEVAIVHDCDDAGRLGAEKWAKAIAAAGGRAKVIELESGDLREFVIKHGEGSFSILNTLRKNAAYYGESVADMQDATHVPLIRAGEELDEWQLCLNRLGIEVVGSSESGSIQIFSRHLGSVSTIRSIDSLKRFGLIQACGQAANSLIVEQVVGNIPSGKYSLAYAKTAIAIIAAKRRASGGRGVGIWFDENEVILANSKSLSAWDGSRLSRIDSFTHRGMVYSLGAMGGGEWFDHDELERTLPQAESTAWCDDVWRRLVGLLGRWEWRSVHSPGQIAAMIGVSMLQHRLAWRPHVAITGAANAGKSVLLNFLFGHLDSPGMLSGISMRSSASSAAGIRQFISRSGSGLTIAIDEWDSIRGTRTRDLLDMIRISSGGDSQTLGTSWMESREFKLWTVFWLCGVHCGMDSEMDESRFLWHELVMGSAEKRRQWAMPTREEIERLRRELLAIVIVNGNRAASIVEDISRKTAAKGVNERVIRGVSCAAAVLTASVFKGEMAISKGVELSVTWANETVKFEAEILTSQVQLLENLLSLNVDRGGFQKSTVADLISKTDFCNSELAVQMESQLGIGVKWVNDEKYLACKISKLGRMLGFHSSKAVSQVARRLPGVASKNSRVGGSVSACLLFPWQLIESFCLDCDNQSGDVQDSSQPLTEF